MKPHSRSWPAAIVARPLPAFDGDGDDDKDKDKGIDLSDPKVQSAIKAAVEEQTAGLKANRDEVLAEKRELKKQMDELKAQWGDLDPKAVTELMKRFENDEEAKLIAEGKFDEVVQRRVDRMQKDAQAQVEAAQKRAEEMEQRLRASEERAKNLAIDSRLDRAAREL